jgi:hypothetical protein
VFLISFPGLLLSSGIFSKKLPDPDLDIDSFEAARAFVFAKALTEKHPFAKIVIIAAPDKDGGPRQKLIIDNLKKGFGDSIFLLGIEEVPVGTFGPEKRLNISKDYSAKELNALLQKYPDYTILLTIVGLPFDLDKLEVWVHYPNKKAAVFDGLVRRLGMAIAKDYITLVSTYRPGWTYFPNPPESPEEKFQLRYILIDSGNIQAVARQYPWIIPLPK